ncbi:MAG: tetratricopeptide repeat protein [Acidiferrobacterales bacterium]|nr:tetratricopeptide repeat protein [Acidiferrobacterales bacterium]
MGTEPLERKLTTILYADVAGYSRLTGEDEEGTHRRLSAYLDAITHSIERHNGKVMHFAGDAVLAEFASVVNALTCAVAIQDDLKTRNQDLLKERRVQFRIGINIGDVIADRGEIYGDGVNIAARLESLADPGGICISRPVFDQVKNKLKLGYEHLGQQMVKNIAEPVNAYRVLLDPALAGRVIGDKQPVMRWQWPAVTVAVVLVVGGALIVLLRLWTPDVAPASVERMAFPLPDKPSIAVLPFDNLSGDLKKNVLADGITENIITALSKIPNLFVIARNSSFTYKGKAVKVSQVAEELGVRYVLEGSVQGSGERVRVTAQLIDVLSGHHQWAERYDRNVKDFFALQDEIALNVVTQLEVQLTEGDKARLQHHGTGNLEAVLLAVQSREYMRRFTKEDNRRARELAQQAIELDPKFSEAYVRLGWTHYLDAQAGWSESPSESFNRAVVLAQKALELDDAYPDTYLLLGALHLLLKEHDTAIAFAEKGVALRPNQASNLALLAFILNYAGEPDRAIALLDKAMRLSPYYPDWYLGELGRASLLTGQYGKAIAALTERIRRNPDSSEAQVLLAAAYGATGQGEQARAVLTEFLKARPGYTLEQYAQGEYYKDPQDLQRVLDGLRQAGLTN